jgi:hypothetical protein
MFIIVCLYSAIAFNHFPSPLALFDSALHFSIAFRQLNLLSCRLHIVSCQFIPMTLILPLIFGPPGKRNTALAFFTSYERSLLKTAWGTQKARLTRDSFLPFGSCQLCLLPSREPVSCSSGDLFCRECALGNILAQKKEISRLEKELERSLEEENEKKEFDQAEEQERAVREFELVQMGLEKKRKREGEDAVTESRTTKKKFELNAEEMLKVAKEDRLKMRTELEAEKVGPSQLVARIEC